MAKQIIGNEKAVEALAALCENYRATALRAIREGREEVLIPADPRNPEHMLEALGNPDGLMRLVNQGEGVYKDPCYASREEFLAGGNVDGTQHRGYLIVDVVAKVVTDLKDRQGKSVVSGVVMPFNPQAAAFELLGKPQSYCL